MEEQELILEDEMILKEYLRLAEKREYGQHRDADQFENLGILCPSGHPGTLRECLVSIEKLEWGIFCLWLIL